MKLEADPRLPTADNYPILRGRLFDLFRKIATEVNRLLDGYLFKRVTVTGAYSANLGDSVILTNLAAPATITLPDAKECEGKLFVVKTLTASTATVATVAGNIDGSATTTISTQYNAIRLISDGANYWKV